MKGEIGVSAPKSGKLWFTHQNKKIDFVCTSFGNPLACAKNRVTPFVILVSKSALTYLFAQFHKTWGTPCGSMVTRRSLSFSVVFLKNSSFSAFVAFSGGGVGTGTFSVVRRCVAGNIWVVKVWEALKVGWRRGEGKAGLVNNSEGGNTGRTGRVWMGSHVNGGGLEYDRNMKARRASISTTLFKLLSWRESLNLQHMIQRRVIGRVPPFGGLRTLYG